MADHVQEILSHYSSDNAGTKTNIVIFSGEAKPEDKNVFEEVGAIRAGGGFGSIIGRNSFQRPKAEPVKFLQTIMGIHAGEIQ
jgi:class I fructose-bisphosphate aldolase